MPSTKGNAQETSSVSVMEFDSEKLHAVDMSALDPQQRIELVRRGHPTVIIAVLFRSMDISKRDLIYALQLSHATVSESGKPIEFDAPRWGGSWLTRPLPALAGVKPATYIDTIEGQRLVRELLSMSQSCNYPLRSVKLNGPRLKYSATCIRKPQQSLFSKKGINVEPTDSCPIFYRSRRSNYDSQVFRLFPDAIDGSLAFHLLLLRC